MTSIERGCLLLLMRLVGGLYLHFAVDGEERDRWRLEISHHIKELEEESDD